MIPGVRWLLDVVGPPRVSRGLAVAWLGLAACCAVRADAQRSVFIIGPQDTPMRSAIPAFTIGARDFDANDFPVRFTLQIATNPGFSSGILVDTSVTLTATSTVIAPRHLLPERTSVYWRGVVTTARTLQVNSLIEGPRETPTWLTLLTPNGPNGSVVSSRRPVFQWSVASVDASAGRWLHEIRIIGPHGETVLIGQTDDSSYVPIRDLETNTSYHWFVKSWIAAGDTVRVQSAASFVVLDPAVPPATILFQNFPNPFPNARVSSTCVWFDLRNASAVDLQVFDLHGNHVRSLIPSAAFSAAASFSAGRYGRASEGSDSGCDPRLSWDGTDDSGRTVPPGVYLIRLRADGVETLRKALFKGR